MAESQNISEIYNVNEKTRESNLLKDKLDDLLRSRKLSEDGISVVKKQIIAFFEANPTMTRTMHGTVDKKIDNFINSENWAQHRVDDLAKKSQAIGWTWIKTPINSTNFAEKVQIAEWPAFVRLKDDALNQSNLYARREDWKIFLYNGPDYKQRVNPPNFLVILHKNAEDELKNQQQTAKIPPTNTLR